MRLRLLADDLTGALDCAAAFGAGVPVHLGRPPAQDTDGVDIVASATRDIAVARLPELLDPCLPWLRGADLAFKKVDSLLRGNTFDEVDWLARQGLFSGLAMVPAFPAQGRLTDKGQQWWQRPHGERTAVAESISQALTARGWLVRSGTTPPVPDHTRLAWVPDVRHDAELAAIAAQALQAPARWLWCGSAGLAHALSKLMPQRVQPVPQTTPAAEGQIMLVSASHHAVTRGQWRVLQGSSWAADCRQANDLTRMLQQDATRPKLIDLSAQEPLTPAQAAALLAHQVQLIAHSAPRPRTLVVVGGDTLLALCQALGASALRSDTPLARAGWGCARMVGGRWDGLVCHTRSGAFGEADDLLDVLGCL